MKALLKKSRTPGDLEWCEVEEPSAAPGRLVASVSFAGICQSDYDIVHDLTEIYRPPVVLGHEFSAVVTEIGDGVEGFEVGDLVVSETALDVCGVCDMCIDSNYEVCDDKQILGWTHNGAFAERIQLNPRFSHRLPASIDPRPAALTEPLAIGVEAVSVRGRLQKSDAVAVVGPGPCGVLSAFAALQLGAKQVFLIGREPPASQRLALAQRIGIPHAIDSRDTDAADYVRQHNGGRLADLVVDATGTIGGFQSSLDLVKRHGRLIELGSITEPTPFDWPKASRKAIDLAFVFSSSRVAWQTAIKILSDTNGELEGVITGVVPLPDFRRGFELAHDSVNSMKVLMQP